MKKTKTDLEEFYVMGIQARTTNAAESGKDGKIAGLWARFYMEQVARKIPDALGNHIFGVYHNYQSNRDGEYTVTIGLKVRPGTAAPSGLQVVKIPKQNYQKVTTDKGAMPGIVVKGWQEIWRQESADELKRKYGVDFELYDSRSQDQTAAEVDIFIAI